MVTPLYTMHCYVLCTQIMYNPAASYQQFYSRFALKWVVVIHLGSPANLVEELFHL